MRTFKKCNCCGREWDTRQEFLIDKDIIFTGYQVNLLDITKGLFLFNDNIDGCETTLALPVKLFCDLYRGKIASDRKFGQTECEGKCLDVHNLDICHADCKYAYIRKIMRIIKHYK